MRANNFFGGLGTLQKTLSLNGFFGANNAFYLLMFLFVNSRSSVQSRSPAPFLALRCANASKGSIFSGLLVSSRLYSIQIYCDSSPDGWSFSALSAKRSGFFQVLGAISLTKPGLVFRILLPFIPLGKKGGLEAHCKPNQHHFEVRLRRTCVS